MAAQFTPEQLGQLEQLFATRLAQQAEAQRAEVENQVGARIQPLQELAQSQYAAGTNLEQQLQEAQAELASTQAELASARGQLATLQSGRGSGNAEITRLRAENEALQRRLSEMEAGRSAASGGMSIDQKALLTVFSEEKAPKYNGQKELWADWEFVFRNKLAVVAKAGSEALNFAQAKGNPETTPITAEEIRNAGYEDISQAVFTALARASLWGAHRSPTLVTVRRRVAGSPRGSESVSTSGHTSSGTISWTRANFASNAQFPRRGRRRPSRSMTSVSKNGRSSTTSSSRMTRGG